VFIQIPSAQDVHVARLPATYLGIPLIALETDVHREPPTEEQIMRVKAFVEMLS
jgi:benzoyl-CoA reductase/2-hydroxyglutaryl-CoA dehydratase subunit BcrC/BadD/HgdB